ncbi:MAG: hypothetical protein TREMPRED_003962 [Tremellales sp. Tagirdzhanova-0007]|nr:MAG: hypothetical protein TREMPRED_003962 [Tremellales sp. Tagirdzhanova-0007]
MVPPKGSDNDRSGLDSATGGLVVGDSRESLTDYHPRPGFGSQGKPIQVLANMYSTRFNKPQGEAPSVFHFDVEINPVVKVANQKKPKSLMEDVFKQACQEATGDLKKALDAGAFDLAKNVYTPFKICNEGQKKEIIVSLREDGRETDDDKRRFRVVFQYANKLDLDTIRQFCNGDRQTETTNNEMLASTQAMNVLFRQDASLNYKPVGAQGRRFFGLEGRVPLSNGGEILLGFMQSFRFTNSGMPAMQLDTAYSAFVAPGLLHQVAPALLGAGGGGGGRGGFDRGRGRGGPPGGRPGGGGLDSISPPQLRKLNEILRTARFTPTHRQAFDHSPTQRVYTIRGITSQAAADLKFLLSGRDGGVDRMVSVVDYFQQQYNVTTTKPRLPCIAYGQKNYIPMEFVQILPFNSIPMRSLSSDQTAEMIRVAAKRPDERRAMIGEWRQKLNYANLPKLKAWGVEVQQNMSQVKARVINPPDVMYGANKTARANFGGWNLKGLRFTKPGRPLKSWAVLSFDRMCTVQDLQKFLSYFIPVLNQSGCPVENNRPDLLHLNPDQGGPNAGLDAGLKQAARQAYLQNRVDPQLVIVILPRKDTIMYSEIKRIAAESLKLPIVTQCLQGMKIKQERGLDQYCGNISMKIHCKLGGVTHQVRIPALDERTMMIGADVTHPPPKGGAVPPSIVCTVSTTSGANLNMCPSIRLQEGRTEIIRDFEDMVYNHIKMFEQKGKTKPEKILVFRDGVSEGQYGLVVQNELRAIRLAAARFSDNYKPKVTFTICAKRHHMRFFASKPADADRTGNLPPGDIDSGSLSTLEFVTPTPSTFTSKRMQGFKGLHVPLTSNIVVADENGFTADSMQQMCNHLCYSYQRATRSVSMIPVAYYADIVAEKCRPLVYTEDDSLVEPSVSSGTGGRDTMEFDPLRLKKRIEDSLDFNSVGWYM